VRFTALAGGTGLNTTTNYFVRAASGATFKLATTNSDATIVNFSTNITAGTLLTGHSVQVNVTLSENTTETNSALVLSPKGTGAFILGPKPDGTATGGNARGTNAVDLQITRTNAAQVASGSNCFVVGTRNTASGSDSAAIGYTCSASGSSSGYSSIAMGSASTASGIASTAIGRSNLASATNSTALGFCGTASANAAMTLGFSSVANRDGMIAFANGNYANNGSASTGDAQNVKFVVRGKTTTNAAVELVMGPAGTIRIGVPSGKAMSCLINISGIKSDGSTVAHYVRQYALKNVSGTTSQVYAPVTIGTDNAAGTSISISADDANDSLKIEATGITSEIWRWVASVDAVEIAYGI
jgi:hypothetical protein